MARTYKLHHFTKGTGAAVGPIEDASESLQKRELNRVRVPRERRAPGRAPERVATPLPAGHVRKKSTGEIGRVLAVDPRAGTADAQWLRQGRTAHVPLPDVSGR